MQIHTCGQPSTVVALKGCCHAGKHAPSSPSGHGRWTISRALQQPGWGSTCLRLALPSRAASGALWCLSTTQVGACALLCMCARLYVQLRSGRLQLTLQLPVLQAQTWCWA